MFVKLEVQKIQFFTLKLNIFLYIMSKFFNYFSKRSKVGNNLPKGVKHEKRLRNADIEGTP